MVDFAPFENESDALDFGNFSIENRMDRVTIYGTLDLTCDRAGLAAARRLRDVLALIVDRLERVPDLPIALAAAEPPVKVKNPFG